MQFKMNLRLFDEELAEQSVSAEAQVGDATTMETETAEASRPTFKDLIKGDYKEEADKYIQGLMNKRFKANKDNEAIMQKQRSILDVVGAKYGLTDSNDLDGLLKKVQDDDSYYEEKAMEEGLTVEQYRKFAQAEAKNRQYEAEAERNRMESEAQARVKDWQEQAETLKQKYPDFDLRNELDNPQFTNLLKMGYPMENAYYAINGARMLQGAMERTATAVREATAGDIAARGNRPRENASSGKASASVRNDVTKLTREDREALSRRAMAGEIITFS